MNSQALVFKRAGQETFDAFVPDELASTLMIAASATGSVHIQIVQDDVGEYCILEKDAITAEFTMSPSEARGLRDYLNRLLGSDTP